MLAVTLASVCVACSALVDFQYLEGGGDSGPSDAHGDALVTLDGGGPGTDGAASNGDGAAVGGDGGGVEGDSGFACPASLHGPALVPIDTYCIDATEVTNAQYSAFVNAPNPATQPSYCSWNSAFAPKCTTLNGAPNAAVTCVNWCDARAYCAWAGKRLCGRIGGGSGAPGAENDPTSDQWYRACSYAGARTYPYGSTYATVCNDKTAGALKPIDVGSSTMCVGGYPGVFDMSGNAVEWEDACTGTSGSNDNCLIRSGAWDDDEGSGNLTCAATSSALQARNLADTTTGFRCCAP